MARNFWTLVSVTPESTANVILSSTYVNPVRISGWSTVVMCPQAVLYVHAIRGDVLSPNIQRLGTIRLIELSVSTKLYSVHAHGKGRHNISG